ncbi:MAG TPA: DNA/RNA nuclease SfsA [Herpetosiphonaceae bacterium]|nr:DNA/RNA nuclease SfsA [Herpetosiphonaceae bacterium]
MTRTHPIQSISVPLLGGAPLVEAAFLARPNQFLVEARLGDGTAVQAHLADRGRLLTQLVPGATLVLGHKPGAARKTQFQVAGVYVGSQLVSLDTVLPNRLIEAALRAGAVPPFAGYGHVEREVRVGGSRFDFGLAPLPPTGAARLGERCPCLLEVKSVADVQADGLALFPDAPTTRGRRHLLELAELAERGVRAAVAFVAQRGDARAVAVNMAIDPAFGAALAEVAARGVEIYAFRCPLTLAGITLAEEVPVKLEKSEVRSQKPANE